MLGYDWETAYAAAVQAAPESVMFLPYLAGERTPLMDARARGAWLGLSAATSKAAMMRAAFEGVAFALRAGLDALRHSGHDFAALRLAGGGSLHPWWRQLLADVLGIALSTAATRVDDAASARGAALLAGLATGHWRTADLPQLSVPLHMIAEPRPDTEWTQRYARHAQATAQLQQLNARIL